MEVKVKMESNKRERVERELKRLEALFIGVDENRKDFVQRQIEELAWLVVSVADLQKQIDTEGLVVEFQNGRNQSGLQQHPATKTLNDFTKHINTITRTLLPLVPEKISRISSLDEFFIDSEPLTEEKKEAERKQQMEDLKKIKMGIKVFDDDGKRISE